MTLIRQVFGGFSVASLISVVIAVVGWLAIDRIIFSLDEYASISDQARVLTDIQEDILEARLAALAFRSTGSVAAITAVQGNLDEVLEAEAALERVIEDPATLEDLRRAKEQAAQYGVLFGEAEALQAERDTLVRDVLDQVGPNIRNQLTQVRGIITEADDSNGLVLAAQAQESLLLARLYVAKFLVNNAPSEAERALTELVAARDATEGLSVISTDDQLQSLLGEALAGIQTYAETFEQVRDTITARNSRYTVGLDVIGPSMVETIETVLDSAVAQQLQLSSAAKSTAATSANMLVVVAVVGIALMVGLAIFLGRRFGLPVRATRVALEAVAAGDVAPLEEDRRIKGATEFRELAKAIESLRKRVGEAFAQGQMLNELPTGVMVADPKDEFRITYANDAALETLKRVESHLPVAVDQIVGSSIDIFHKNPARQRQMLSDASQLPWAASIGLGGETFRLKVSAIRDPGGAYVGPMVIWQNTTQLASLERSFDADVIGATKAMEEALSTMQGEMTGLATHAEQGQATAIEVASSAEQATNNADAVAAATEELNASIREIAERVQQSASTARTANEESSQASKAANTLAERVTRIEEVVTLITSIAEQTNLLALNATIEAARAGDAGKGFAVVANEVKTLATQTGKATDEIRQTIQAMTSSARETVDRIDGLSASMVSLDEAFAAVSAAVEEQSAATQEIAGNVNEAASGMRSVAHAIGTVAEATRETKGTAESVGTTAGDLSHRLGGLSNAASAFLTKVQSL